MNGPAMLADHLDARADAVIDLWRRTIECHGDVPDSEKLSEVDLVDHIPQLLERLAERLRGRLTDSTDEGRIHARLRWRQGYDASQLINELGHLRTVLLRSTFDYAREQDFDLFALETALTAIDEVLYEATAEAVAHFQTLGAAETQAALAQAEAARVVAESEQTKLRILLDQLPVGVWVVDPEGRVVGLNREAERLQGFPESRAVGVINIRRDHPGYRCSRPDGTAYAADDLPLSRALRGQTAAQEEILWPDGDRERIVAVSAAPLAAVGGQVAGAVAVVQDITRRRLAERRLARQLDLTRAIAANMAEGLYAVDAEGRLTFLNQTAERMFGWSEEELRGRPIHDAIAVVDAQGSPTPAGRCPLLEPLRTAVASRGDVSITRKDRPPLAVAYTAAPIVTGARVDGVVLTFHDIGDRIELERALEEQRALAEASSRHKTRLLSALSHDARTPLNAVFLAAQLLELHCRDLGDPEVDGCLRTIRHSVVNVLDLLGDLLNLSKIDAGALPAEVSRFALGPVLAESLSSIEAQARVKGLALRIDPSELAGAVLETDRAKLKQVLCNLLSNALRYTDRGHIQILAHRSEDRVQISVEDTGLGIAPADQGRIFDEFATLDRPGRPAGEGTGLGLAICRRLTALLGGEISLESTPGEGSTFTLSLPASILSDERIEPIATPKPVAEAPAGGLIIVAEDHPTSRQTLAKVLRRMGYRALEAGNGLDALALIAQERPLAVLMDVNMPLMNGIEAIQALRADPATRDLPIFALTGDVTPDNQSRIGEAGVTGYLEKPVSWENLKQALESLPR